MKQAVPYGFFTPVAASFLLTACLESVNLKTLTKGSPAQPATAEIDEGRSFAAKPSPLPSPLPSLPPEGRACERDGQVFRHGDKFYGSIFHSAQAQLPQERCVIKSQAELIAYCSDGEIIERNPGPLECRELPPLPSPGASPSPSPSPSPTPSPISSECAAAGLNEGQSQLIDVYSSYYALTPFSCVVDPVKLPSRTCTNGKVVEVPLPTGKYATCTRMTSTDFCKTAADGTIGREWTMYKKDLVAFADQCEPVLQALICKAGVPTLRYPPSAELVLKTTCRSLSLTPALSPTGQSCELNNVTYAHKQIMPAGPQGCKSAVAEYGTACDCKSGHQYCEDGVIKMDSAMLGYNAPKCFVDFPRCDVHSHPDCALVNQVKLEKPAAGEIIRQTNVVFEGQCPAGTLVNQVVEPDGVFSSNVGTPTFTAGLSESIYRSPCKDGRFKFEVFMRNPGAHTLDLVVQKPGTGTGSFMGYVRLLPVIRRSFQVAPGQMTGPIKAYQISETPDEYASYPQPDIIPRLSENLKAVFPKGSAPIPLFDNYNRAGQKLNNHPINQALDFTGVAFGASQYVGTLVSRRHIVTATHLPRGDFRSLKFWTRSGEVLQRSMLPQGVDIPNTDISVYKLDQALPDEIKHYRVLSLENNNNHLVYQLLVNQFGVASVSRVLLTALEHQAGLYFHSGFITPGSLWDKTGVAPFDPDLVNGYHGLIVGDSGHPAFVIGDNNELLLTGTNTSAWAGPSYSNYLIQRAVRDAMRVLDSRYP